MATSSFRQLPNESLLHSTQATSKQHLRRRSNPSRTTTPTNNKMTAPPVLNVEPAHSVFTVGPMPTMNRHEIVNTTDRRHAFKVGRIFLRIFANSNSFPICQVKCSNNDFYRVGSVYGFVEPQGRTMLEIHRLPGGNPGPDRFVVQWAEVPAEETDPRAPFLQQAQSGEVVFTVAATAAASGTPNN